MELNDQVYSNTGVHNSTRVNSVQNESSRVRHELTGVNMSPTRVRNKSTQVNNSKKKSPRLDSTSQQKFDMSVTRIWESRTNCRSSSGQVIVYDFSGTMSALYLTAKVSSQILYWICLLFTLVWFLLWIQTSQLSGLHHVSHGFITLLTVSR